MRESVSRSLYNLSSIKSFNGRIRQHPALSLCRTLKIMPSGTHRGHNSMSAKSGLPSLLTGFSSLRRPGSSSLPIMINVINVTDEINVISVINVMTW